MKILVGTHYFETHQGGVEIVAGELGRALADQDDLRITWMASDATAAPSDFPGEVISLKCSNLTERTMGFPLPIPTPAAISSIKAAVKAADAVLLHDSLYPTNVAAAKFARRLGKPVVLVQHIGLVPYRSPVLRYVMKAANHLVAAPMLKRADQVVFISGLTEKYFSGMVRYERQPKCIFNGIRREILRAAKPVNDPPDLNELNQRSDRPEVLFVGRFVEKKGVHIVERLVRLMPGVDWLMCGWGDINPEAWGTVNLRVFRNLDGVQLAGLYKAADLLVLPSVGEGLPLVVQEALACGLRVMSSAELLVADPWLKGRIIIVPIDHAKPDNTALVWKAAVEKALKEGLKGADGREARERYSWDRIGQEYADILRSAIKPVAKL